jgi:hypothetical protein
MSIFIAIKWTYRFGHIRKPEVSVDRYIKPLCSFTFIPVFLLNPVIVCHRLNIKPAQILKQDLIIIFI